MLACVLSSCIGTDASAESLLSSKPYTAVWSRPGFLPAVTTSFVIGEVVNDTGRSASFDVAGYFRDQLRQELLKEGFAEAGESPVRIDVSIRLFQEGGTFGRWAGLPGSGAGAAYCVAHAEFRRRREAKGAEVVVTTAITGGGLFSLGAERTVVNDIVDEIVALLKSGEQR